MASFVSLSLASRLEGRHVGRGIHILLELVKPVAGLSSGSVSWIWRHLEVSKAPFAYVEQKHGMSCAFPTCMQNCQIQGGTGIRRYGGCRHTVHHLRALFMIQLTSRSFRIIHRNQKRRSYPAISDPGMKRVISGS